jgi:uncharacterized membrane protein
MSIPIIAATPSPVLLFVNLLATCVWVGGFVAIGVVVVVARRQLGEAEQVAFFRALGRSYGVVGGAALTVALASGAVLLGDRGWDRTALAAVVLAAALVIATVAGVAQARGMTRLRDHALRDQGDAALATRLQRGAKRATVLRATIGALTLALLATGAVLVR